MDSSPRFTNEEVQRIERGFIRNRRAWELLGLIVSEWESDPMSAQCFDLRIVSEAKELVRMNKLDGRGQ